MLNPDSEGHTSAFDVGSISNFDIDTPEEIKAQIMDFIFETDVFSAARLIVDEFVFYSKLNFINDLYAYQGEWSKEKLDNFMSDFKKFYSEEVNKKLKFDFKKLETYLIAGFFYFVIMCRIYQKELNNPSLLKKPKISTEKYLNDANYRFYFKIFSDLNLYVPFVKSGFIDLTNIIDNILETAENCLPRKDFNFLLKFSEKKIDFCRQHEVKENVIERMKLQATCSLYMKQEFRRSALYLYQDYFRLLAENPTLYYRECFSIEESLKDLNNLLLGCRLSRTGLWKQFSNRVAMEFHKDDIEFDLSTFELDFMNILNNNLNSPDKQTCILYEKLKNFIDKNIPRLDGATKIKIIDICNRTCDTITSEDILMFEKIFYFIMDESAFKKMVHYSRSYVSVLFQYFLFFKDEDNRCKAAVSILKFCLGCQLVFPNIFPDIKSFLINYYDNKAQFLNQSPQESARWIGWDLGVFLAVDGSKINLKKCFKDLVCFFDKESISYAADEESKGFIILSIQSLKADQLISLREGVRATVCNHLIQDKKVSTPSTTKKKRCVICRQPETVAPKQEATIEEPAKEPQKLPEQEQKESQASKWEKTRISRQQAKERKKEKIAQRKSERPKKPKIESSTSTVLEVLSSIEQPVSAIESISVEHDPSVGNVLSSDGYYQLFSGREVFDRAQFLNHRLTNIVAIN